MVKGKGLFFKLGLVIGLVLLIVFSGRILETVNGGEIHIKQAAITGELSTRAKEGVYMQNFGKITKYHRTAETYLSSDELDGGKGNETSAVLVRFGDGGTADLSSVTQWRLPLVENDLIKIQRNFRSMESLSAQVRQWIIEVEKQTASTFKADETYSTRRSEFQQLISNQIVNGLYATEVILVDVPTNEVDEDGIPITSTIKKVVIKTDKDGFPVYTKIGVFKEYGIALVNHSLKDIDYDETIDALITQKKKAEQQKAVAITNAEKALQDAITAEAQGQARVAEAKADQDVKKITAVTSAEKERDVAILKGQQELKVAELATLRAKQEAEAELVKRQADAQANALLVKAGLTPKEKATIQKETAIGVARELAKTKFPQIMNFGTDTGVTSPLEAVGYNQTLDLINRLTTTK